MGHPLAAGVLMVMDENPTKATGPVGPETLGRLFDEHATPLEFYARQWCANPEDVVQEVFILLAAEPESPQNPTAWLYCAVRTRALNSSRSARRRQRHESVAAHGEAAWFVPSPGDRIDAHMAADVLETLPDDQREVVVAHVWGGLSFRQIGELAGISSSTAHRRYDAALSTLREELGMPCLKNSSIEE